MNAALHASDAPALTAEELAAISPSTLEHLVLPLEPSVALLASRWPVDAVWRANQPGGAAIVDLEADAVELEIRRIGDDVVFRRLSPGTFAFRAALGAGQALGAAVDATVAVDPAFDVPAGIRALLDDRVVTRRTIARA
jgi:hypothetical protein